MNGYIYESFERGLWTVGHRDESSKWHSESDHDDPQAAADRVHYLNGGADAGLTDELARMRDAFGLLAKISSGQARALYATWIEIGQHKNRDAALMILSGALDGYDGPEWDGRESGKGWLDRTRPPYATPAGDESAGGLR